MSSSTTKMKQVKRLAIFLAVAASLITAEPTRADRYAKDVMLNGAPVPSEHISGFQGSAFEVGVPDSSSNDDYAVYGLTSEEQRDQPCYVTVRTENVNDSNVKQDLKKEFCSGKEKSREMGAAFTNTAYGKRSFVTGVRVCMNGDDTRVKGIQIRGGTITDHAQLGKLDRQYGDQKAGNISHLLPEEPKDERPNCNSNWKRWALCPNENQIATAVVLHFEAGKEPRSLTGIGLKCRNIGGVYVPQSDRTP
ncbi:hypothetical protein YTPLAS72_31190 [Nitrospira sp.]|nr:hypothetical protein YTPLAS72_31190 [Nitrospira sp.]